VDFEEFGSDYNLENGVMDSFASSSGVFKIEVSDAISRISMKGTDSKGIDFEDVFPPLSSDLSVKE